MTRAFRTMILAALLLLVGARRGDADAAKNLNACQSAVASAATTYIKATTKALGTCLDAMSSEVIAKGSTTAAAATAAAPTCSTALAAFTNTASPKQQLASKFDAKVAAKCDPAAHPKLGFSDADTYTIGATTLGAANLASTCRAFGGNGTIDRFATWRDCLRAATECEARQAIAAQWPRALEFFAALKTAIAALPPSAKTADALAALTTIDAAIEGATDDDRPELTCGVPQGLVATGQKQCDQGNGTMGACPAGDGGQDGDVRAGVPLRYTDNGDGTITDRSTGLMWAKLDDSGGTLGVDRQALALSAVALRVGSSANPYFPNVGGYGDWRAPNIRELESLVDLDRQNPAIDPVFDHDCVPNCTVDQCSCTRPAVYVSSTESVDGAFWAVSFADGSMVKQDLLETNVRVRPVRGGRLNPLFTPGVPAAIAFDLSIRHPWKSSCVPMILEGLDPTAGFALGNGTTCAGLKFASVPNYGFITQFTDNSCLFNRPPGTEDITPEDWFHLQATYCYVPFSQTFTGVDSFTYQILDSSGVASNVATVTIEIF